jgi:hypothetical protein
MKDSSDTICNRTRDLPACSAMPQPTAQPRLPKNAYIVLIIKFRVYLVILYFITGVC